MITSHYLVKDSCTLIRADEAGADFLFSALHMYRVPFVQFSSEECWRKYIGHSESVSLAVSLNEVRLRPGFGSFKQQAHVSSFQETLGDFKVWVNSMEQ